MNFVDLHVHLLPGVDDGSKSIEESLAMGQTLVKLGYTQAAPSPHNRPEYRSRDAAICKQSLDELKVLFASHQISLGLEPNAENFFLDERLLTAIQSGSARTFGKRFLLIEAPYQGPLPHLKELVFKIKLKGLTPVIAHPERCFEFDRKGRAAEIKAAGAHLQLDIGALTGRYGKSAQQLAKRFLDDHLYSVAATDMHSPKGALEWISESLRLLKKQVGDRAVQLLLSENPGRMLATQDPIDLDDRAR
jgi:protein-tyrosine phosphatase